MASVQQTNYATGMLISLIKYRNFIAVSVLTAVGHDYDEL